MLGWRIGDNGSWDEGVMHTDGPLLEAVCCYIMVECRTTQVWGSRSILVLMMFKLQALVALGVALFSAISRGEGATTVVVNGTPSHAIAPLLCE